MSDILIKGMEMPKNYPYRITIHSDGHVEDHSGYSGHGHYQAIPVPEHGDLIERDKLSKVLSKAWNTDDDSDFANRTVWRALESAEVVLEAST